MDDQQTGSPSLSSPQSDSLRTTRRSTFLARPLDQSEAVYADAKNTPERNHELLIEYERLQRLNQTLGTISDNLEKTKLQFNAVNDTIDRTNGLLDVWLDILKDTEDTKSFIEDPASSVEKDKKKDETDHNKKRRING